MLVEVSGATPITITAFDAETVEYGHNLVSLTVAQQQNTDRIELERSYDGRAFETVTSVP